MLIPLDAAESVPRHELELLVIHIGSRVLHREKLTALAPVWRIFGLGLIDLLDRRPDPPTPELIDDYADAVRVIQQNGARP